MSETPEKVVYVEVKPQHQTNHILHLLISVVTAGLWIPVWIIIAAVNSSRRNPLQVASSTREMLTRAGIALGVIVSILLIVGLANLFR